MKLAFELPPLEAPKPSEIWLRIVGPMPEEANGFDAPEVAESAFSDDDDDDRLGEEEAATPADLTSSGSNS